MNQAYKFVTKMYPHNYLNWIEKLLIQAGEKSNIEYWLGTNTILSLLIWIALTILSWTMYGTFKPIYFFLGLGIALLIIGTMHLILYLKIEDRIRRIENVIPDMLQLVSSNLRAGMTPYQSLSISARPEFGPLAEEIEHIIKKGLTTASFTDLLLEMSEHIKSNLLERVTKMFSSAIRSGGKLAQLLEEIANDLSQTKTLKQELITTTKSYTTFILFTIIIGTPLLFAISIHFIEIISDLQATTPMSSGFGLEFLAGGLTITPEFLTLISLIMLVITSILTSILLGVIQEGKELYGLRYSPLIIGSTLTSFYIAKYLINLFFII